MWQRILLWTDKTDTNKLTAAIVLLLLGVLLREVLPYFFRHAVRFLLWLGKHAGGRLGYYHFQRRYLDWVVTELSELKLAGIVSVDSAKKPKLDQVFVSLRVGEEEGRLSAIEAARAVVEELQRTKGKLDRSVIRALKRDIDQAAPNERKDAEAIIIDYLVHRDRAKLAALLLRQFKKGDLPAPSEETILQDFLQARHSSSQPSAEYAAILLRKILRDYQRLAILGSPGAGKTTLLQYIGLAYAKSRAGEKTLRCRNSHVAMLGATSWKLPIFISLGSVAKRLAETMPNGRGASIIDVIPQVLPPDLDGNAKAFFTNRLKKGRCVVLLDGLDEVPTDVEFRAVVRAIESLAVNYPKNQYVVTSRIAGWRTGVNAEFKLTYVGNLSEEQIEFFLDTWCSAVELNAVIGILRDESKADKIARERRAAKRAGHMKGALRDNPGIRQLATNPMLLSIIALVQHSLRSLPRDRAKLYESCAKILLDQWDVSRGLHVDDTHLRFDQKEAIMRRIAYALHTGEIGTSGGGREANTAEIEQIISGVLPALDGRQSDAAHLLRILVERSGLLVERRRDVLAFAHLTFQEYFTARYCSKDRQESRDFLLQSERVMADWWREPILLYSGMLTDSSEFLQRLHATDSSDLTMSVARLSGWCLGEAVGVRQLQVRQTIGCDLLSVRTRGAITKVKGELSPDAISYLIEWSKSESWFSHAIVTSIRTSRQTCTHEVGTTIAQMLQSGQIELLRSSLDCLPYLSAAAIVPSISAVLPELLLHADHKVRAAALRATRKFKCIGSHHLRDAARAALNSTDFEIKQVGLQICAELGPALPEDQSLMDCITRLLSSKTLSWRSRRQLAALFPSIANQVSARTIECFLNLALDEDNDVRREARRSISQIVREKPDERFINGIIVLLKSNEPPARALGLSVLGEVGPDIASKIGAVSHAVRMFSDKSDIVRESAVLALQSLATHGLDKVIESTLGIILDGDDCIPRACAIKTLAGMDARAGSTRIQCHLLSALGSRNREVRIAAATAAGLVAPSDRTAFVPKLILMTNHRDARLRASALRSLGLLEQKNPSPELLSAVARSLRDGDEGVRAAAAGSAALFGRSGTELVPEIIDALRWNPGLNIFQKFSIVLMGMFPALRQNRILRPGLFMSRIEHVELWDALVRALGNIPVNDPDRAISELHESLISGPWSFFKTPFIVTAVGAVGSKYRSSKSLEVVFTIVGNLSHIFDGYYPGGWLLPDVQWLTSGSSQAEAHPFETSALSIARSLPHKEVIRQLKAALEDPMPGVRLLGLRVAKDLDAAITSELYPLFLKRLNDEEPRIKSAAWMVTRKISVTRELWVEKKDWEAADPVEMDG